MSHLGPLGLHQVDQNMNTTQVSHTPCGIVPANITLLNGAACTLLGSFNVIGPDVFLRWHEPETL